MPPLRERMIQDMELHSLAASTQNRYIDAIRALAKYYRKSPDRISEEELRGYFLYLTRERHFAASTLTVHLSAIKFLLHLTPSLLRTVHTCINDLASGLPGMPVE